MLGDFFGKPAFGDDINRVGGHADGLDKRLQHVIDANDKLLPFADKPGRVAPRCQLPGLHRDNQAVDFLQQLVHGLNQRIQIRFDRIKIALIRDVEFLRNVPFGNAFEITRRHADRRDKRFDDVIHADHQFAPIADKAFRVAAFFQLPLFDGQNQPVDFR